MQFVFISIATFIACFISTIIGFGISTIMVPVLALFITIQQTLLFTAIIHGFHDIWKMMLFPTGIRWRLILLFGIPSILFTGLGATLVFLISTDWLMRLIAIFLFCYVLLI